ncbi:MAG: YkgJ family cysteine cluster protein [Planctomycetes bacterium]|nr:YkgJ family cysteine cluster protein [Planctomycetota bacterium]
MSDDPCLSCGACCACYRVSFYWSQTDDIMPEGVPKEYTEDLPPHFRVMKGTSNEQPYCIALKGTIGRSVCCSIYPVRSDTCRNFPPSYEQGIKNERCDKARGLWGLKPLEPWDWVEPVRPACDRPANDDGDPDTFNPFPRIRPRVA